MFRGERNPLKAGPHLVDYQQMRESRAAATICVMAMLGAVLAVAPKSALAAPAPASVTTVVGGVARGHTSSIGHETAGIVIRGRRSTSPTPCTASCATSICPASPAW